MSHLLQIKKILGFTLVELLVVLGLFSSIATLSLGSLFNAQAINGRLQQTQAILDNVNLSTQTVTRDIRFGTDFYCATSVPVVPIPTTRKNCEYGLTGANPGSVLIFKPADATSDGDRVAYYINNGILYKNEYPFGGAVNTLQMTANEVEVKALTFFVEGALTADPTDPSNGGSGSDLKQPLITFLISGVTRPVSTTVPPTEFNLQTSISSRDLDNK